MCPGSRHSFCDQEAGAQPYSGRHFISPPYPTQAGTRPFSGRCLTLTQCQNTPEGPGQMHTFGTFVFWQGLE
eukprot:scaffold4883_cov13-Tisochrysis_lutea.AAC.1